MKKEASGFSVTADFEPSSTWQDCEAGVFVQQFTELAFDSTVRTYEDHALLFQCTGVIELTLNESESRHLIPGQGAFLCAGSSYTLCTNKNSSFVIVFFPDKFLLSIGDTSPSQSIWKSQIIANDDYLTNVMQILDKEVAKRDHHSDSAIKLLTQYIAIHLVRNYSTINTQGVHEVGRPEICQIVCALEYIELNLFAETSIGEVISQTNLTKHRFLHTFKEITGRSPQQYIIVRRLEVARHLLRRLDLSLEYIARESGFVDQSHFSKAFRKHFGQTPALFRGQ